MNKINSFSDRASKDIIDVTRRIKRRVNVPVDSRRRVHTGGKRSGANSFVFEITSNFVRSDAATGQPATALATIYDHDDETVVIATDARWVGNMGLFDHLTIGRRGICIKVGNEYVAQNTFHGEGANLVHFQLTADLASGYGDQASATSPIGDVVISNSESFRTFTGASGVATEVDGVLWIVHINQPGRVVCRLAAVPNGSPGNPVTRFSADPRHTTAYIDTASCTAVETYPYSFMPTMPDQIANPHELFGEAGDEALLRFDRASDQYVIEEIYPQRQLEFWGTLYADRTNGRNVIMQVMPETPASHGGMISSPISVKDRFNVAINGKKDHRVLCRWDAKEQEYVAIESEHIATHVQGYVTAGFSDRKAEFKVTVTGAKDGLLPTTADIDVKNRFGWEALDTSDKLDVFWDTDVGEWYPFVCECPDDPTPTYF